MTSTGEVTDKRQVACPVEHEGKKYVLYFDLLDGFDPNTESDLSDACNYKKPVSIWSVDDQCEVLSVNKVITVQEAAEILGIDEKNVRLRCVAGKCIARKAGGTWLIDKDSL